jgi:hypothetical protein
LNLAAHIAAETAHIERMARIPGAREYARDKAQKMAKWQPAMYGHLPEIVSATPLNPQETTHAL